MSTDAYLNKTRKEYQHGELDERSVAISPFEQFRSWFDEAMAHAGGEPNACALATVGSDLRPTVRMLLLKAFDERGFVFFTNYLSRKGAQLSRILMGRFCFIGTRSNAKCESREVSSESRAVNPIRILKAVRSRREWLRLCQGRAR
jgi:pyridoxine/pyridoxamine 5'-phosphate oxidase